MVWLCGLNWSRAAERWDTNAMVKNQVHEATTSVIPGICLWTQSTGQKHRVYCQNVASFIWGHSWGFSKMNSVFNSPAPQLAFNCDIRFRAGNRVCLVRPSFIHRAGYGKGSASSSHLEGWSEGTPFRVNVALSLQYQFASWFDCGHVYMCN